MIYYHYANRWFILKRNFLNSSYYNLILYSSWLVEQWRLFLPWHLTMLAPHRFFRRHRQVEYGFIFAVLKSFLARQVDEMAWLLIFRLRMACEFELTFMNFVSERNFSNAFVKALSLVIWSRGCLIPNMNMKHVLAKRSSYSLSAAVMIQDSQPYSKIGMNAALKRRISNQLRSKGWLQFEKCWPS